MALTKCKECGQQISSKAESCPHCGVKVKAESIGCLGAVVVIFGLLWVASSIVPSHNDQTSPTATKQEKPDPESSARGACMLFIKQVLNDPSSAEFGHSSEAVVYQEKNGVWVVQRRLRAKNAFNALVLTTYECRMTLADGNWSALSIKPVE